MYYPMEPMVKLDVVEPEYPERMVGMGQTGRICLTVLSEERFLPRMVERDLAERWAVLPALGCEGVADVRSLSAPMGSSKKGVY